MTPDQAIDNSMHAAFEAAHYRILLGDDSYVLHIGTPSPAPIAEWVSRHAVSRCAWLMTAHNPNAEQIDAVRNRARDSLLRTWAEQRAITWLETVNEDTEGGWPAESGVLIAGLEEGEVRAMARRFGQAAIVAVLADSVATLVWIR